MHFILGGAFWSQLAILLLRKNLQKKPSRAQLKDWSFFISPCVNTLTLMI